jgi:hypothetical protein
MVWNLLYNKIFSVDVKKQVIEMTEIVKQKVESRGGKFLTIILPNKRKCLNNAYNVDISGLHYFDIMQYFLVDEKQLDNLFFDYDVHYNVNGHELVAKALIETLVKENFIEKKYLKTSTAWVIDK